MDADGDGEKQIRLPNDGYTCQLDRSISPDGSLLFFREPKKPALYTNAYEPIKSWQIEDGPYGLTWSRDSPGVFFFTDRKVYSLAISDDQLQLVEDCPLERCEPVRFVWLR